MQKHVLRAARGFPGDRELAELQVSRHDALERKVEELEKKNYELDTLLRGLVNREIRMVELKEQIQDLENKLKSRKGGGTGE